MIYVNKKLKYLFDYLPTPVNEYGDELGKFIYSLDYEDEIKNLSDDEWNVIHLNGEPNDLRKKNLELVIFTED